MPTSTLSAEATSRTLDIDGVPVHFHEAGAGELLLMLHSWGPAPGTSAWVTMRDVFLSLAETHRCVMMDMPNFGLTGPVRTDNSPVHHVIADTLVALMDSLDIESARIVAPSMGGSSALVLATEHPERVDALVIGDCHPPGQPTYVLANNPSEAFRVMRDYLDEPSRRNLSRWLSCLVYTPELVSDELVDQVERLRQAKPDHLDAYLHVSASGSPYIADNERLRTIEVPTLIIHGRHDRVVPVEQAMLLAAYIPRSEVVIVSGAGHWVPYEKPKEYASHVLRFLNAISLSPKEWPN